MRRMRRISRKRGRVIAKSWMMMKIVLMEMMIPVTQRMSQKMPMLLMRRNLIKLTVEWQMAELSNS